MEEVPLYGNLHYLKTGRTRAEGRGPENRSWVGGCRAAGGGTRSDRIPVACPRTPVSRPRARPAGSNTWRPRQGESVVAEDEGREGKEVRAGGRAFSRVR